MFDPIWFHLVPVRVFFLVWSSLGCGFPFSRGGLVKRDAKACMSRHRAWVLFAFSGAMPNPSLGCPVG